jgi:hypothetical protein
MVQATSFLTHILHNGAKISQFLSIKFKYGLYTIFLKNTAFWHGILGDAGGRLSLASGRSRRGAMNHEEVLAVLPDSKEEAKSIKEIAMAMGLEISSYVDWVRAERRLVRALGALIRWGWVACDERQKEDGHKFWYNAYWKTEPAK